MRRRYWYVAAPLALAVAAVAGWVGVSAILTEREIAAHAAAIRDIAGRHPSAAADAAAIMKLGRHLPKVAAVLGRLGLAEAARIVVRAGHADQRLLTLPEALAAGVPYFSLLLVRKRP